MSPFPIPTTEETADWLLNFIQKDVKSLREGELIDTRNDAAYHLLDPRVSYADGTSVRLEKLDPEMLQKLQDTLREGLQRLDDGRDWLPFDDGTPINVIRRRGADAFAQSFYVVGPIQPALLASAVDVLTHSQIRRCKYEPCSRLFRPEENRQMYHTTKCSSNARWRRSAKKA